MANTITYTTLFEDVLQDRLDRPQNWKDVCDVTYSDVNIIRSSYMSTTPAITTVTQGTGFTIQDMGETSETLTIATGRDLAIFLDWRDYYQSPWSKPSEIFDRIGHLLNEFIESNTLAQHASWTNFGYGDITGGTVADTTQITVSAGDIDDIIRGVHRVIRVASGHVMALKNGSFAVWRPADFEFLEAFTQANGSLSADKYLVEGADVGMKYLGMNHYVSNDHAANHVFAGVRKLHRVGILRSNYGRAHTIEFPAGSSNNNLSGLAFYSRIDIGQLVPTGFSTILFDVNVA